MTTTSKQLEDEARLEGHRAVDSEDEAADDLHTGRRRRPRTEVGRHAARTRSPARSSTGGLAG
jgi:hypothetical protein